MFKKIGVKRRTVKTEKISVIHIQCTKNYYVEYLNSSANEL